MDSEKEPAVPLRNSATIDDGVLMIGVGASAGGLAALEKFLGALPEESPEAAYVVVLHLEPDRTSHMAEILDRHSELPVTEVSEEMPVEANHVYVIAPHTQLELEAGGRLVPKPMPEKRPRNPVDAFFRSVADVRGGAAVGVLLSGSGSDGTRGLTKIREAGGVTAAQDPEEAEHGAMPESAIATGHVQLVRPAAELPAEIVRIRESEGLATVEMEEAEVPESALDRIVAALQEETGYDLGYYKRSTFLRRIDRRMRFKDIGSVEDYARRVENDPDECRALYRDLLISVSSFFRDPGEFEVLEEEVVPGLFEGKGPEDDLRVWVPGCATGEEAYSLAILLHEHAATHERSPKIHVFATDIDERAIAFARQAAYPESIVEDVSDERVQRFFLPQGDRCRVIRAVRETVLFALHDLLTDPPFSQMDLVSCRNLLIYMQPEAQRKAIERIHYGLREGGVLFTGSSESPDRGYFEPVAEQMHSYRRVDTKTPLPLTGGRAIGRRTPDGNQDQAEARGRQAYQVSAEGVHGRLLRQEGPPSVVVDDHYEIVHISEGMDRFLHHVEGEPTDAILELVPEPFELELRTALYRAFRKGEGSMKTVQIDLGDEPRIVELRVRPDRDPRGNEPRYALIVFEEHAEAEEAELEADSATEQMVRDLQRELQRTKEQLRSAVEQREATIEELQSANEELQSVNEEQKATTEELETRREELQSVNEELQTINQEHRNKIDELARTNADLQNLMASTQIATLFLDERLQIRRFTPRAADVFNVQAGDEGRPFEHITHRLRGDDREVIDLAREVLESDEGVEREMASRDERNYIVRVLPYRGEDTERGGVVITCFDITERKRMEKEVLAAKADAEAERSRLAGVMEHMSAGVLLFDRSAERALTVNERARRILRRILDIEWEEDDAVPAPALPEGWPVREPFETGEPVRDREVSVELESGERRVLLIGASPIREPGGEVQECVFTLVDITERKRTEEELRRAKEQAEEAERAKGRFLATISHELRTPLNAIVGYTELLVDEVSGPLTDAQAEQLERIQICVRFLNDMVEQIVTFSRMDDGEPPLHPETVDPGVLVRDVGQIMEPRIREKELDLRLETGEGESTIVTDPDRVRQILLNLAKNAVKFTTEGAVTVAVVPDDEGVVFEVRDTGTGIAAENLGRIFERFWQGDEPPGHLPGQGGIGLGLTVSQGLARKLGGLIEVESSEGRGSVFRLRLPAELPEEATLRRSPDDEPSEAGSSRDGGGARS